MDCSSHCQDVSMDFIEGLLKSLGADMVMVVVDRFTKYSHFLTLTTHYIAKEIAQLYFEHKHKVHGLPRSIITDRDKLFTSIFWLELFEKLGTKLHLSTAYHPQTDGQTKSVNRSLKTYIRCMFFYLPHKWRSYLDAAEWWFNTNYHNSLQLTPFQALYGYPPPQMAIEVISSEVAAVDDLFKERQQWNIMLKEILLKDHRMKQMADKDRLDRVFEVGDMVYLKLQPYRYWCNGLIWQRRTQLGKI